jgi:hypothetical protein
VTVASIAFTTLLLITLVDNLGKFLAEDTQTDNAVGLSLLPKLILAALAFSRQAIAF